MNKLKKLVRNTNIHRKASKILLSYSKDASVALLSFAHNNITRLRSSYNRMTQNFLLVWLDNNIDEVHNDDCRYTITKLREIVNVVNTYTETDRCIEFINQIGEEKTFMIVSGTLGRNIMPIIDNMSHVTSVYIFCQNKERHEEWAKQWPKIKGIFTEIEPLCEALKHAAQECDRNEILISFASLNTELSNQNFNQSFMYTEILKEIFLTIDFDQEHFDDFITYCQEQFVDNTGELENVDKLKEEYRIHSPIWWYTYHCFLYSMLNRALRTMEIDILIKIGFFLRDLHEHIVKLHAEQYVNHPELTSFIVYRGQGLSQIDFDQLVKTNGGFLSFNNFLSTSKNRDVSLRFAHRTIQASNLIGILFVITIDPSIISTPFANIEEMSSYQTEEEILFSMHSVFHIDHIEQIDDNDHLWQVDLTLTSDNDSRLRTLTEHIREETCPHEKGWYRLVGLLITLGQYNKAQQVCEIMLDQTSDDREKADIYHMLAMAKGEQGECAEAIIFYEKSIDIKKNIFSPTHVDLHASYAGLGLEYEKMGEYTKALSYHQKSLEICQKTLSPIHPDLATSYACHGSVYEKMNDYLQALSFYEKAHEIYQKTLPSNHPDLGISYGNIGKILEKLGEYPKALQFHEKSLDILQNTLPPNHPHLAICYASQASVYDKMGDYVKAVSFFERAVNIGERLLPTNHRRLQLWQEKLELIKKRL